MVYNILQLIALFLFILFLASLLGKNKIIRYAVFVLGTAFLCFEISSLIFSNALFDFKYYTHLNLTVIKNTGGFFFKETMILIVFILISFLLGFKMLNWFGDKIRKQYVLSLIGILGLGGFMFMPKGVFKNISEISSIHFAKQKGFNDGLSQLNLEDYTLKENITAKAGKNIIVILLESVEEAYLKDNLGHLTPNLREMSDTMTYYNMKPAEGSNYTIGAVYTYLTGLPHFFKNHGNEVFGESVSLKVSSISNALDKAGYTQEYLLGNADFAGTRKMLNLFDIDVKSELDFDPKYKIDYWGFHDKDLFEIAHKEIKKLKEKKQPFAYYISTISTHPPNGIFDQRMTDEVSPQKSMMEFMVAATDLHVKKLVDFLQEEGLLENTALYIIPDHLLMGTSSRVINDFDLPRDLFVLTNTEAQSFDPANSIYQIDVPKLILEGAGVEHNMVFLADKIKGDKGEFISSNKTYITQLNEASLVSLKKEVPALSKADKNKPRKKTESTIYLESKVLKDADNPPRSFVHVGMKEFELKRGVNLFLNESGTYELENFDTYENEEVVMQLLQKLTNLVKDDRHFFLTVHDSAGDELLKKAASFEAIGFGVLATLKNRQAYIAHSNFGYSSELKHHKELTIERPFNPTSPTRTQTAIDDNAKDVDRMIAHAGGIVEGTTYTNSLEALERSYKNGFRLFELDIIKTKDGHYVAYHNWKLWRDKTGFSGAIPPNLNTFKENKVEGGFTSLDMDDINNWFSKHKDAILITDKINDPDDFIPKFIDRDRLMMELFSFEAVEKAQALKIKDAILTGDLLDHIGADKVKELQKRNISKVATSIRKVGAQKDLYKKIMDAGIKVYAYHINVDPFRDEAYMVREAMDYCYGLYADDWLFGE